MSAAGVPQRAKTDARFRRRPPRNSLDWQDLAACRSVNPDLFSEPALAAWGLEICRTCPVQKPCGESRHGATGIWGNHAFYPRKAKR